jgi:Uri superfamily endonuclease
MVLKEASPIDNAKGTYILILKADTTKHIQVGRLGKMALRPGFYLYVGSAFGAGGLKARLDHHLKRVTKAHWHIDYLRRYAQVIEVWYTTDAIRREDQWVAHMTMLPKISVAYAGFGASDSKAASHLFVSTQKPDFAQFCKVTQYVANHAPIHISRRMTSNHYESNHYESNHDA